MEQLIYDRHAIPSSTLVWEGEVNSGVLGLGQEILQLEVHPLPPRGSIRGIVT